MARAIETAVAHGRAGWLAGGGIAGALLASACCVLPLALFSLGIGGAWVGRLTALAPYQPWFWAGGALFVVAGLVGVHRGGRACRPDGACSPSRMHRIARTMGAEGIRVESLDDVGPALREACEAQRDGKTTVLEVMVTRELGDPFRRDALQKPTRHLDKYRDYD